LQIQLNLSWLNDSTLRFLQDVNETRESGMLDNSVLPLLLALKSEISDALLEIGALLHFARHPSRKINLGWRPEGLMFAQQKLNKEGLRNSLAENLFVTGQRDELIATRQIIAFSATLFAFDRLATSVRMLWMNTYNIVTSERRSSLLFKPSHDHTMHE